MRLSSRHQTRPHQPQRRPRVSGWRTSQPQRYGHSTGRALRPNPVVCLLLVSGYGRGLRMVAGGLLISLGASVGGGLATTILASLGLAALLEAMFDLCLAAPFLGCPVDGAAIRKHACEQSFDR